MKNIRQHVFKYLVRTSVCVVLVLVSSVSVVGCAGKKQTNSQITTSENKTTEVRNHFDDKNIGFSFDYLSHWSIGDVERSSISLKSDYTEALIIISRKLWSIGPLGSYHFKQLNSTKVISFGLLIEPHGN
jgi:hypothetical protein